MAGVFLRQGQRYRATLSLGLLEQIATNEMIEDRLRQVGFTEVNVTGQSRVRHAEAVWARPDTEAELPEQVFDLAEVHVPEREH